MKTTVIDVRKAIEDGNYHWKACYNDCEFKGVISNYVCGFCVEVKNNNTGKIDYTSCTFTNDFYEIKLPEVHEDWNELGLKADCCAPNWEPTGRIVFRGYYREFYDFNEHDYYYRDASEYALEELNIGNEQ